MFRKAEQRLGDFDLSAIALETEIWEMYKLKRSICQGSGARTDGLKLFKLVRCYH